MDCSVNVPDAPAFATVLSIFPNPVPTFASIQLPGVRRSATSVGVFDAMGRLAFRTTLPPSVGDAHPSEAIDCTSLAPGMYTMEARVVEQVYRASFIKE
jgi:hypothetical protein